MLVEVVTHARAKHSLIFLFIFSNVHIDFWQTSFIEWKIGFRYCKPTGELEHRNWCNAKRWPWWQFMSMAAVHAHKKSIQDFIWLCVQYIVRLLYITTYRTYNMHASQLKPNCRIIKSRPLFDVHSDSKRQEIPYIHSYQHCQAEPVIPLKPYPCSMAKVDVKIGNNYDS